MNYRLLSLFALLLAAVLLFSACGFFGTPGEKEQPETPDEQTSGEESDEPDASGDPDWQGGFFEPLTAEVRVGLAAVYTQKRIATQGFAPVTTHGTVYYISSIDGKDYHAGTSPKAPWRTLANCSRVKEGDTILFECGSVFRRTKNDYFIRGLPNKVTLATYGEGAKPIFYGSINVPAEQWIRVSKNSDIYYFDGRSLKLNIYSDVGAIVFGEGEAWGIKTLQTFSDPETKKEPDGYTLALEGVSNGIETKDIPSYPFTSGLSLQGDLSFYHDYNEKRVYLLCEGGNPAERFGSVELSLSMFAFSMQSGATDMTFQNLDFRNFGSHVIRPLDCTNLTVQTANSGSSAAPFSPTTASGETITRAWATRWKTGIPATECWWRTASLTKFTIPR